MIVYFNLFFRSEKYCYYYLFLICFWGEKNRCVVKEKNIIVFSLVVFFLVFFEYLVFICYVYM